MLITDNTLTPWVESYDPPQGGGTRKFVADVGGTVIAHITRAEMRKWGGQRAVVDVDLYGSRSKMLAEFIAASRPQLNNERPQGVNEILAWTVSGIVHQNIRWTVVLSVRQFEAELGWEGIRC